MILLGCDSKEIDREARAKTLMAMTLEEYKAEEFFRSTVTFNMGELEYKMVRDGVVADFEVTRQVDTLTYKAVYKNGYRAYLINDSIQPETSYSNLFIDIRLEGIMYFFTLPREFDRNYVHLKQLEDVIIKKKTYHAVHVSFTRVSEDDPEDELILYIDPDTKRIKYFAEFHQYTAAKRNVFKVAHNFRRIDSLLFADYYVLVPRKEDENEKLEDLYKLYNANNMDELPSLIFENIEVQRTIN